MPGRTRKKPPAPLGRPPPPTASSLKNLWKRSAFDGLVDQTNGLLQAARSDNRLPVQYRQKGAKPTASEQGGGGIKPKKFRPKKKKRMQAAPSPSNCATKTQDQDGAREEDNNDKASSSSEEQAALVIQRRTRGFIVREGRRRSVDEADQWLNDDPGPQPQQKKLPKPKQPPKQEAAKEEAASKQVGFSAQKQEGRNETADQKTTDFRSRGLPKKSQSMKEVLLTNSSSRPAVSFSRSSSMPDHPDLDNLDLGEFNVDVDDSDDDYSDDDKFDEASGTKKEKGQFEVTDSDDDDDDDEWTLRRIKSMPYKRVGMWEARKSVTSGNIFYVKQDKNSQRRVSDNEYTWKAPPGFEDWEEFTDDATGRPYYYNQNTKVSQWEAPAGLANVAAKRTPVKSLVSARSMSAIFTKSFHELPKPEMEKEQEELLNLDLSESDDEDGNEDEWVIRRMHSTKLRQLGEWGEYESESGTTFYFSSPKRTGTWQKPAEVEAADKEADAEADAEEAKEEADGREESESKVEEAEAPVLDTTSESGGKSQEGKIAPVEVEEAPAIAEPSPGAQQEGEDAPAVTQKQRPAAGA